MAVSLVQQTNTASDASSTTLTCTLGSAPAAGNLLVFAMAGNKNTGALTLAGFTSTFSLLSTSVCLYCWWKVSDGTETAISPSWANSAVTGNTAWYVEYHDGSGSSWQQVGQASTITNESTTRTGPCGTTAAVSAAGQGIALGAIDASQSIGTQSAWTSSFVNRYSALTLGARAGIFTADKAIARAATATSQFGNIGGTADQISAAIVVYAVAPSPPSVLVTKAAIIRSSYW